MFSRYATGFDSPDPSGGDGKILPRILEILAGASGTPFLLPTNDEWLSLILSNRDLFRHCYLPIAHSDRVLRALNKTSLYDVARESGVPTPRTETILCSELPRVGLRLGYPFIMKPVKTDSFMERLSSRSRVFLVWTSICARKLHERLLDAGMGDRPLVAQEYIPGNTSDLYTFTSLSDSNGKTLAHSTGHKIRQFPPDAGTICSGRLEAQPKVIEYGKRMISALGLFGIANTEFKRHARTGEFYLMETNPRAGKWTFSATASGVNIPLMLLRMVTESFIPPFEHEPSGSLVWLTYEDPLLAMGGYRLLGYPAACVSLTKWARSVQGKKVWAFANPADPVPLLSALWCTLVQLKGKPR